ICLENYVADIAPDYVAIEIHATAYGHFSNLSYRGVQPFDHRLKAPAAEEPPGQGIFPGVETFLFEGGLRVVHEDEAQLRKFCARLICNIVNEQNLVALEALCQRDGVIAQIGPRAVLHYSNYGVPHLTSLI